MSKSLVPAIQELESMFDHIYQGYMKPIFDKNLAEYQKYASRSVSPIVWPQKPIINLSAPGKRTAKTWYVPGTWENTTSNVVTSMAGRKNVKLGELNVSTDLLVEDNSTIMKWLAGGAFMHLNSIVAFTMDRWFMDQAYNSKTGYWYKWKRSPGVYGLVLNEVDAGQYNTRLAFQGAVLDSLQKHIDKYVMQDSKAFQTHRDKPAANVKTTSGGLKKWQCPACKIPIRASKVLYMVCQCGEQIEYADKDKEMFYKENNHYFEGDPGIKLPPVITATETREGTNDCKHCGLKYRVNLWKSYTNNPNRPYRIYVDGPHLEHDPYEMNERYNGPYYVRRSL